MVIRVPGVSLYLTDTECVCYQSFFFYLSHRMRSGTISHMAAKHKLLLCKFTLLLYKLFFAFIFQSNNAFACMVFVCVYVCVSICLA